MIQNLTKVSMNLKPYGKPFIQIHNIMYEHKKINEVLKYIKHTKITIVETR